MASKDWIPGQPPQRGPRLPGMTRCIVLCVLFRGWVAVSKRLDHGSIHPTKPLRALARTPTGRDDAVYSLVGLATGKPFHLSTSKNTFPPIIAPIYYEGMALICITLSVVGLPGVNLIIYKDDLRMMVLNPVVAKAEAMKDIAECLWLFMRWSRN